MSEVSTDLQALKLAQKIIKAKDRQTLAYRTGSGELPEWVFDALASKEEFENYMNHRKEKKQ